MKTSAEFKESLKGHAPGSGLSVQLKSLWYDGKGDWHKAHHQVDHLNDEGSAWVHAYLHRKEGDNANADYWYRKSGKTPSRLPLEKEWEQLVDHFLSEKAG